MLSIRIKAELPDIKGYSRAELDEIGRRLRGYKRTVAPTGGGVEQVQPPDVMKAEEKELFRWEHYKSGEGICDECAPYLYQVFTLDELGGADPTPLHLKCNCYLAPWIGPAPTVDPDNSAHMNWLASLTEDQLAAIAGPVRAKLVSAGEIAVDELWDTEYKLVPLKKFGYDDRGRRLR